MTSIGLRIRFSRRLFGPFACATLALSTDITQPTAQELQETIAFTPPQLYLTSDSIPKKGHIEKTRDQTEGKVSFRECTAAKSVLVEEKTLKAIGGTCDPRRGPWTISTGRIESIGNDGSVQIQAIDYKKFRVSAEDWKKTSTVDFSVGDFVGFKLLRGEQKPMEIYAIAPRRAGKDNGR
jgi:hypothetical protein